MRYLFILLGSIFLITACDKEEVISVPAPEALFDVVYASVTTYEVVEFNNLSSNSTKYEWDFGDGNTSTILHPSHTFREEGIYSVILKAYNSEDAVTEYSIDIHVVVKKLSKLFLLSSKDKNLPSEKLFYFGKVDGSVFYYAIFPPDAVLPFGGDISFEEEVVLDDSDWYWMLIENRPPLNLFDDNDQLIFGAVINPAQYQIIRDSEARGSIIIEKTKNINGEITEDYSMRIGYQIAG